MRIDENWFSHPLRADLRNHFTLELCITDVCNLSCRYCCQATPVNTNKRLLSLEDLRKIAVLVKPYEFFSIKLSGGEPTIHPDFAEICNNLSNWFTAHHYCMATNGYNLLKYRDYLHIFDSIDMSLYPGLNDTAYNNIKFELRESSNIYYSTKIDGDLMRNVFEEKNLDEADVFFKCRYPAWKKIVQNRIYPCSNIFGQAIRQGIDLREVSAPMDDHWRENLAALDIEPHCKKCWVKVTSQPTTYRLL